MAARQAFQPSTNPHSCIPIIPSAVISSGTTGAGCFLMCKRGSPSFGSGHWRDLFISSFSTIARVICLSVIPARRCASHNRNCISANSLRSPGSAAVSNASFERCFSGPTGPTSPNVLSDHSACSRRIRSRSDAGWAE